MSCLSTEDQVEENRKTEQWCPYCELMTYENMLSERKEWGWNHEWFYTVDHVLKTWICHTDLTY